MGRSIGFACGAVVLLSFAALSPRLVPYNMDEFVHYHALGCASAPLQRGLPAFRDGCGLYDLRLPLTRTPLPLRSYYYIGSFPAVPFYPFWRLLDDPVAVRLQGAVFFLAWILLAGRLLRVPWSVVALAGLVFPTLLVAFLVDEGPVGLAAVLFTGALLLARRAIAVEGRPRSIGWGALGGVVLFLGLWSKLVFACLFPAVVLFTLEEIRSREGSWRLAARHRSALAGIALGLLLPSALLLASTDVEGRPYAAAVQRGRVSTRAGEVAQRFVRLVRVATEPDQSAPRNVVLTPSRLDALPPLLCAAALLVAARQRRARRRQIAGWTALAALTLGLLSLSAYCQWPHHAFYGLLLLTLALTLALDTAGQRARLALAVLVLAGWATLGVRWAGDASYPTESAPGKDELLRFVRQSGLDRGTLQVHTSWGTYYVAQLFGDPARMVVYLRALSDDPVQLAQVRELARGRGRPLLMVGSRRWERFQTPSLAAVIGEPSRRWTFGEWWVAEYPTSASPRP